MTALGHILAEGGGASFWLPKSASNLSTGVDWTFNLVLYTSIFFFCVIVTTMIIFVIRFRRRTPNDRTPLITHNTPLEMVWTGIPLILVVLFFYLGFKGFINYDTAASDAYVIDVEARQWSFTFNYPNGGTSSALYVPFNKPVKLILTSKDVLHALYIPAFRTQRNAVPGRTTEIWFVATMHSPEPTKNDPGGFPAFCTQYCGDNHSRMFTQVHVLDEADFQKKLTELANPFRNKDPEGKERWVPYVTLGEKLATDNGCFQCHSTDGTPKQGPTWKGLYKSGVTFGAADVPGYALSAGDPDDKWEAYLREHILAPGRKVVTGFPAVMNPFPQFDGPPGTFKDEKLRALIEYIKSLGPNYAGVHLKSGTFAPDKVPAGTYDVTKGQDHHPESLAAQASAATQAPEKKDVVP
jgi:cytochrome c oxidase subunit 2